MAGGTLTTTAGPLSSSISLQSLNGLFAIYKKQGPTSADVLNKLKEVLLKGNTGQRPLSEQEITSVVIS